MSLVNRTISGVRWTAAAGAMQRAIQFVISIVLMRMLGPEAFGLIAMVVIFTGFAAVLSDLGFASAVIHKADSDRHFEATAFWSAFATGGVFAAIFFVGAEFVAIFYETPELESISRAISLTFLASSTGAVPRALLTKRMKFGSLAIVDTVAVLGGGIVALGLAFMGVGVWALVFQQLIQAYLKSALAFARAGWRPNGRISRAAARELIGFGAGLTGFSIVNYWARNADNLLIGKYFGSNALGLYSRAYALMMLPLSQMMAAVTPVLFPTLAQIQNNVERTRRVFLRVIRATTFMTFPISLGLISAADPFVSAVLGTEWASVVPLLQILTVAGAISSAVSPLGSLFLAQGRTQEFFYVGLASSGAQVAGIFAGTVAGSITYVAWGLLAGHAVGLLINYGAVDYLFEIRLSDLGNAVRQNVILSGAMLALTLGVRHLCAPYLDSWGQLSLVVLVGAGSYLGGAWMTNSPALTDALLLIRRHRIGVPIKDTGTASSG